MRSKLLYFFLTLIYLSSTVSYANDIELVGVKKINIFSQNNNSHSKSLGKIQDHTISLLDYKLSEKAQNKIVDNIKELADKKNNKKFWNFPQSLPSSVYLEMNDVPVLNQGYSGSCVTFATTALLDALLYKSDYISQLCLLQLGSYLEDNTFLSSGWNGEHSKNVIEKIRYFGIISKENEKYGCGGLTSYPLDGSKSGFMTIENYKVLSENVFGNNILKIKRLFPSSNVDNGLPILLNYDEIIDRNTLINNIKQELKQGSRVLLGLLLASEKESAANGTTKNTNDTWVLSSKMILKIMNQGLFSVVLGGHEMVITGYDDNAIAYDDAGKPHKGLFKLRNSWGSERGDNGDYYVSYDYLTAFIIDSSSISKIMSF